MRMSKTFDQASHDARSEASSLLPGLFRETPA